MSLEINRPLSEISSNGHLKRAADGGVAARLSAGLKISRRADGPAQLKMSENLRMQTVSIFQ